MGLVFLDAHMTLTMYAFLNIMKVNLWSGLPDVQHTDYLVTLNYVFFPSTILIAISS